MKFKITTALFILLTTAFTHAERKQFETFTECTTHIEVVLNQFEEKQGKEILSDFGLLKDPQTEKDNDFISTIEKAKELTGNPVSLEKLGSSSIGTILTKLGYILRCNEGGYFFEVKVLKHSDNLYTIEGLNFKANDSLDGLIKEVPESYWKHK